MSGLVPFPKSWRDAYHALGEALPAIAAKALPLLTGFAACVDKRIDLHDAAASLAQVGDPAGQRFFATLMARAEAGRGGEILVDWPQGPVFLDAFADESRTVVGGTSAQAAWTLGRLGASAILALGDRSALQLSVLDPAIQLAGEDGKLISAANASATGIGKPAHYIIEYTAGRPLLGLTPPRSSRIIVRFADEDMERDPFFRAYGRAHGSESRAALLSSPNAVAPDRLPGVLDEIAEAVNEWRAAGIGLVHLELGDYPGPGTLDATLERLTGSITSVGLSLSELREPGHQGPDNQAVALAERLGLSRVAVHADHWALAVTRDDPARELDALAVGCLLASARADAGHPVAAPQVSPAAMFASPPFDMISHRPDGWAMACVPAPFLPQPRSTVGLGDSFTAGTMLIHSLPAHDPVLANFPFSSSRNNRSIRCIA